MYSLNLTTVIATHFVGDVILFLHIKNKKENKMVLVMVFPPVWPWASLLNFWSPLPHVFSKALELPGLCSTLCSEHAVFLCFKSTEDFKRPWGFEVRDMGVWLGSRNKIEYQKGNILSMKDLGCGCFCWKVLQSRNFLYLNHNMDVLKMKSCLEDLYSGEERRSDKYMCMIPNEMWKEKLLKVMSPSSYITRRAVREGNPTVF